MILKMTVRLNGNFKGGPMPTPLADLHDSDGIFPRCHDLLVPRVLFVVLFWFLMVKGHSRLKSLLPRTRGSCRTQGDLLFQDGVPEPFSVCLPITFPAAFPWSVGVVPCPDSRIVDWSWMDRCFLPLSFSVASESRIYEVTRRCLCCFLACLLSSQPSIKRL